MNIHPPPPINALVSALKKFIKSVKIRLNATRSLQTCCKLLKYIGLWDQSLFMAGVGAEEKIVGSKIFLSRDSHYRDFTTCLAFGFQFRLFLNKCGGLHPTIFSSAPTPAINNDWSLMTAR